jgi:hypothetical protein
MTRKTHTAMSLEEIAEETGMTVGAVGMCLSRGLKKLRREGASYTRPRSSLRSWTATGEGALNDPRTAYMKHPRLTGAG